MLRLTVIADARFTAPALLGSSYLASCAKLIDPLHSMGRPCRGEEAPAQLDGPTVAGAYVLAARVATPAHALARLRAEPAVTLAQPLGAQDRP